MSAGIHRRRPKRCTRFGSMLLLAAGFLLGSATIAWAYFTGSTSGTYGLALASKIAAPTPFSVSTVTSRTAKLTWTAPANPSATGYTLSQSPGTLAGCSATPSNTTTSCTATGLTPGTQYTWTLHALDHTWTSTALTATATPSAKPTSTTLSTSTGTV